MLLLAVALCLLLPVPWVAAPAYLGLGVGSVLVAGVLAASIYIDEPQQSRSFPHWVAAGSCAVAVAYSLTANPQSITISIGALVSALLYAVLWRVLVWDSRERLRKLVQRYQQGEAQRELALKLDLETGIITEEDVQEKREHLEAEKRYLSQMLEAQEAVAFQALGTLALYLVFGMCRVGLLWWSFGLSFLLSTSLGMMIARMTHEPNLD